jgi:light-regulated signal transduction histidine kinase (bacteriophytochrome)
LKTICESVLRDFTGAPDGRAVEWVVSELPEVNGDAALLRQVFVNLLGNALKYTRRRQRPRIEISSRKTAEELIVIVKDNGVGFDMKYASKLFGVFQSGCIRMRNSRARVSDWPTSGASFTSTAGALGRKDRPNQGATFYFSLPLKKQPVYWSA